MSERFPGTEGYNETADGLAAAYEELKFDVVHARLLPFMPVPGFAVDIGAGTGRDAAALTAQGWTALAVEPTAALRAHGQRLHPHLTWVDDGLPHLARLEHWNGKANLVLMSAVWMHLDTNERAVAFPKVAALLAPGGVLNMTVRHGPVPAGRRMFDIEDAEITDAGQRAGLAILHQAGEAHDKFGRAEISWSHFTFGRPYGGAA